jgi:hypothetical protein
MLIAEYVGRPPLSPDEEIRRLVKDRHDGAVILLLQMLYRLGPDAREWFACFGVGRKRREPVEAAPVAAAEPEDAQYGLFERA